MLVGKSHKPDRSSLIGASFAVAASLLLSFGCLIDEIPLANGQLSVHVTTGVPIANATVEVWKLDREGVAVEFLTQGVTDGDGWVLLHIGTAHHNLIVKTDGGETQELWSDEQVSADVEMRTTLIDFAPGTHASVAVTPYTTIATALGERRYAMDQSQGYSAAMLHAYQLIGEHLTGIDIISTIPPDMRSPKQRYSDNERYGLSLAGLHGLSAVISGDVMTASAFNSLDLLEALAADISSPEALFDGSSSDGPIVFRSCFASATCAAELIEECMSLCELSASTLRRDLATGIIYNFLLTDYNTSNLTDTEAGPLIEHIRQNDEPELFGDAPVELFSYRPPHLQVGITHIQDESKYSVDFFDTEAATPFYTVKIDPRELTVELGHPCIGMDAPYVRKYVTRLNSPSTNPLKWRFQVFGDSGAMINPHSGRYRVGKLVASSPEDAESSSEDEKVEWLTDNQKDESHWLPATLIGPVGDGGYLYEVIVIRDIVPELATYEGKYVIEFEGSDYYGQSAKQRRCWHHEILAPSLYVSEGRSMTDAAFPASPLLPPSIDDLTLLGPFNNMATYLNGVTFPEGLGLFWFEIKNGTDEPVFASVHLRHENLLFNSLWRTTNLLLDIEQVWQQACDPPWCFFGMDWPALLSSWILTPSTSVPSLVSGIRIWEVTEVFIREIQPCSNPVEPGSEESMQEGQEVCHDGEFRFEPYRPNLLPRRYIVLVMASKLPFFMQSEGTMHFEEVDLTPTQTVTGAVISEVTQCIQAGEFACTGELYRYLRYTALESAALTGIVRITGFSRYTRTSTRRPLDLTPEDTNEIQNDNDGINEDLIYPMSWSLQEDVLPSPIPAMSTPTLEIAPLESQAVLRQGEGDSSISSSSLSGDAGMAGAVSP